MYEMKLRDPDEPCEGLDCELEAGPGVVVVAQFVPATPFRMLGIKLVGPEELALRWFVRQIWIGLQDQIVAAGDVPLSVLLSRRGTPSLVMPSTNVGVTIRIELVNTDTRWRALSLRLLGEQAIKVVSSLN